MALADRSGALVPVPVPGNVRRFEFVAGLGDDLLGRLEEPVHPIAAARLLRPSAN
jgi:hypothetical protein